MSGNGGEVCNREGPAQAVALQVDVHQMLVSEDQGLGILVLQVVHHRVIGIAPAIQVQQAALPPAEVAHLPCSSMHQHAGSRRHIKHRCSSMTWSGRGLANMGVPA